MVRQKKSKNGKPFRNGKLPHRTEAVVALMQMGMSDYATIASSVGLSKEEVKQIDLSEDTRIRSLALNGVSADKPFRLLHPIRCPKCRGKITTAPCLVCSRA